MTVQNCFHLDISKGNKKSSYFKVYDFVSCGGKKSYFDILNLHPEGNNEKVATWKGFIGQRFPGEFEGAMQVAPNEVRIQEPWGWQLPKRWVYKSFTKFEVPFLNCINSNTGILQVFKYFKLIS